MLLLEIAKVGHGNDIIDTHKFLVEDILQQVQFQLRLAALLDQQLILMQDVVELVLWQPVREYVVDLS